MTKLAITIAALAAMNAGRAPIGMAATPAIRLSHRWCKKPHRETPSSSRSIRSSAKAQVEGAPPSMKLRACEKAFWRLYARLPRLRCLWICRVHAPLPDLPPSLWRAFVPRFRVYRPIMRRHSSPTSGFTVQFMRRQPRAASDILNRLNEVAFNAVLLKELRMIALLRQVADPGHEEGRSGRRCASTTCRMK